MPKPKYADYEGAAPYFNLVRGALGDLVDGEHFFDIVADDVVYEVLYDFPGWPRVIQGRADLMAQFRGYVDNIALQSADQLITHKADDGSFRRHRIRGPRADPRDGRHIQQSVLLHHQNRKPENRALARLHGLSRGLERIDEERRSEVRRS